MSYARVSAKLYDMAPDQVPADAPDTVWTEANNVFFRNGEAVRKSVGEHTLPDASAKPAMTCIFVRYESSAFWVYANSTGIWAHDGNAEFDITPVGWARAHSPDTVFTSCLLGGIAYINASDVEPVFWNGDILTPCQPLPNWYAGETCQAMRAHKNFLFAIGINIQNGQRVRWSDAAAPGQVPVTWQPASSNLAGWLDLAPLTARALDGGTLRDSMLIYKSEGIWALDFIGGSSVFAARSLFHEHGIAATNALCGGIDDVHVFAGDDGDIYRTDGSQVLSILDGKAQRAYYSDYAENQFKQFTAFTLSREKLSYIIYPGKDQATGTRAVVFNHSDGSVAFQDMPEVYCGAQGGLLRADPDGVLIWDSDTEAWDLDETIWGFGDVPVSIDDVIVGTPDRFLALSRQRVPDEVGNEVQADLIKEGLQMGNPRSRKLVSKLWPKLEGVAGDVVTFQVGGSEYAGAPITYSTPVPYTIGSYQSVDLFASGRFIALKVSSFGGSPWRLGSIDIEYRETGQH